MYAQKVNRLINTDRDLSMYNYNRRQLHEITNEQVKAASLKIRPAGNFCFNGKTWDPNEYKGYAIVSMVNINPGNEALITLLSNIQTELIDNLQPLNAFYMLPPDSFHQTIANTLSAERFKENILYAGLENAYPDMINQAFIKTCINRQSDPIRMRLVGLSIFGNAIGVLGSFENDEDYNRIIDFRSGFYGDEQLASLDVKITRPFIGHITLAYAEQKLNKNQRDHLANTINDINEHVFSKKHYFLISNTGLKLYDHLADFQNEDNFPVYQFTL